MSGKGGSRAAGARNARSFSVDPDELRHCAGDVDRIAADVAQTAEAARWAQVPGSAYGDMLRRLGLPLEVELQAQNWFAVADEASQYLREMQALLGMAANGYDGAGSTAKALLDLVRDPSPQADEPRLR